MSVRQTMLRPVAWAAGRHAGKKLRQFLAACPRAAEMQDRVLAELVGAHRRSAFGRDHRLDAVGGYDDFRRAVPVGDYDARKPYLDRVWRGEPGAVLPPGQRVLMFSQTSGTTGEPKRIPVTTRFLEEMRRGWNVFGVRALSDHPRAWLRPLMTISSSMHEAASPTGVPCGAISGLLAATQKSIVRRMYVAPPEVGELTDPAAKYYALLRCGVGRDVSIITTANPSSTIKLIETGIAHTERLIRDVRDGTCRPPGEAPADVLARLRFAPDERLARRLERGIARDGQLRPAHFWDLAMLCNWTGGTLRLYLPRLAELFGPDLPVRDIGLLASEGRFSIPLDDGTPAGPADIVGNFLEFIPAAEYGREDPPTLRAHELEVGGEYFLVITNWTGLMRYSLDDRVRVTGFLGECPLFEFLCRGRHTASITGEKITEHQVVQAMRRAAGDLGVDVERFTLQGRFADLPHYVLRVEPPAGDGEDSHALAEQLAARMDEELAQRNVEYAGKRSSGRLGPIRPAIVEQGHFDRAEREEVRRRRGRGEQYKHTYLLTEPMTEE